MYYNNIIYYNYTILYCVCLENLQQYLKDGDYDDVEDLEEKLESYKSEKTWNLYTKHCKCTFYTRQSQYTSCNITTLGYVYR